jgi:hypothetical protein
MIFRNRTILSSLELVILSSQGYPPEKALLLLLVVAVAA